MDDRVSCLLVWIRRVELHEKDILEGGYTGGVLVGTGVYGKWSVQKKNSVHSIIWEVRSCGSLKELQTKLIGQVAGQ